MSVGCSLRDLIAVLETILGRSYFHCGDWETEVQRETEAEPETRICPPLSMATDCSWQELSAAGA